MKDMILSRKDVILHKDFKYNPKFPPENYYVLIGEIKGKMVFWKFSKEMMRRYERGGME